MTSREKRSLNAILDEQEIRLIQQEHLEHAARAADEGMRLDLEAVWGRLSEKHGRIAAETVEHPYTRALQNLQESDPFGILPLMGTDASKTQVDTPERLALLPTCYRATVLQSTFTGQPTTPDEVHDGLPMWPPMRFAWAQPQLGRIEVSAMVSNPLPGISQASGFGFSTTAAHLAGAHLLWVSQPMTVIVAAEPGITGLLAAGGSGSPNDVAGYSVSLQLSATALSSGDSKSATVDVGHLAGVFAGLPLIERLRRRYWLTVSINADGPDFLVISLSLSAVVFQKTGSCGFAMVDIDGATSPPGPNTYYTGGLHLPRFLVADVRCPPYPIDPDPTI